MTGGWLDRSERLDLDCRDGLGVAVVDLIIVLRIGGSWSCGGWNVETPWWDHYRVAYCRWRSRHSVGSWSALCGWIFDCWTVLSCCMLCGLYCGVMEVAYWVRLVVPCGWTNGCVCGGLCGVLEVGTLDVGRLWWNHYCVAY